MQAVETSLIQIFCCAHPTVYYMYAVKDYSVQGICEENKAVCGFYLKDDEFLDYVRLYFLEEKEIKPQKKLWWDLIF